MAIINNFTYEGAPYVHSDLFNFRSNVHKLSSPVADKLPQLIEDLTAIRNELQRDAESFLDGETYISMSKKLFLDKSACTTIAMQIVRDIKFNDYILECVEFNAKNPAFVNFMNEAGYKITNTILNSSSFGEVAENLIKQAFRNNGSGKQKIKIADTGLNKLFSDGAKTYASKSAAFQQQVVTQLKNMFTASDSVLETVWLEFRKRFENLAAKTVIDVNEYKRFLEQFESYFKKAIAGSNIFDISNVAGWMGEDFKNALWTEQEDGGSFDFSFINVGKMTESILKKQVKEQWDKDIELLDIGSSSGQSHSDWVFRNKKGYVVRAQDKNSSRYLSQLKKGANFPQVLKVHDEILYSSLKNELKRYMSNAPLVGEDWGYLDYLVANTTWFAEHKTSEKNSKMDLGRLDLKGIRDLISQFFSYGISYFAGINAEVGTKGLDNLAQGANNTFFVIDNLILFPTYLMVDYIIRQLKNEQDQLTRIQVTIDTKSASMVYNDAVQFYNEKIRQGDSGWQPGQPYGGGVMNVGYLQGASIINTVKISRVNLKFDLKTILTTAYQLNIQDLL